MGREGTSVEAIRCGSVTRPRLATTHGLKVAFMNFAMQGQPNVVPFALEPRSAGVAFSNVTGTETTRSGPQELDRGDLTRLLTAGSVGSPLPEKGRCSPRGPCRSPARLDLGDRRSSERTCVGRPGRRTQGAMDDAHLGGARHRGEAPYLGDVWHPCTAPPTGPRSWTNFGTKENQPRPCGIPCHNLATWDGVHRQPATSNRARRPSSRERTEPQATDRPGRPHAGSPLRDPASLRESPLVAMTAGNQGVESAQFSNVSDTIVAVGCARPCMRLLKRVSAVRICPRAPSRASHNDPLPTATTRPPTPGPDPTDGKLGLTRRCCAAAPRPSGLCR